MAASPTDSNHPEEQDEKKLFAEIVTLAKEKKFSQAEALREKLMEVAPTALSEIIKTAAIIEEEKTAGLDSDHMATWDSLYQELSEEERNCLFYSLKKVVVPPKKRILAHGGYNTRLYFIDKGTVTVFSQKGEKNAVIAQLGRGDMLGEYTFTAISVCSASVLSSSEVHLRYLESAATDDWHQNQPGLYEKLSSYCTTYGTVKQIETRQKQEELEVKRYTVDGVVQATILTKEGKKSTTSFRGGLTEVSSEGCCFEIKVSKKESARALLAKNLSIVMSLNRSKASPTLSVTGRVERVSFHLHNDYTVHVSFHKPLQEDELKKALAKLR